MRRPFDHDRLNGLLKGLEAHIARFSELERTARIDAEYFQEKFLHSAEIIARLDRDSVARLAHVSDGNHFSISKDFVEQGVPYYRGQDVTGRFFVETASPIHITQEAYDQKHMARSHLKRGDVLLSIIGTIGELSLVASDNPATCSCKLAILRPREVTPEYLAIFLRSEHGQNQIARLTRGAVQKGLILEDTDQLWVPTVSKGLEKRIVKIVRAAHTTGDLTTLKQTEAETTLLHALGIADWKAPEPLTYTVLASEALSSRRLDSRFFAPRIQALLDILSVDGRTVSNVARPRRSKFHPDKCTTFNYIEISDIDSTGTTTSTNLESANAPSRATWHVRSNDIITSTVRPIRRLSAQIAPEQNGFVCSSGFVVIEPHGISPEVLLTYLRLPMICELLDLYASASMYPAITDSDIFNLPLPNIQDTVSDQVTHNVRSARIAKARAILMLDAAKRAVEIAIEDGEHAAMTYLDQTEEEL